MTGCSLQFADLNSVPAAVSCQSTHSQPIGHPFCCSYQCFVQSCVIDDGCNQGIFGDEAFKKIKKGARIVNVARGGVIDDAALARALDSGAVAQAALDVYAKEPPPPDNPLIGRPDVICTPHLGASTTEAQEGVSLEIAEAVVGALKVWLALKQHAGSIFFACAGWAKEEELGLGWGGEGGCG